MAPAVRLLTVEYDVPRPASAAAFWAGLLDRPVLEDGAGLLLPGDDRQVGLRFGPGPVPTGRDEVHLHLTSEAPRDQQRVVERARGLGAAHLEVGQGADEAHVVLADPEGDELCVIEPGNAFLAGCGPLGEVACDGTREVGLFWSRVLGWPLVWDRDGETAVQSPSGGTKVAWSGTPAPPRRGRERQRMVLPVPAAELAAEVARLEALGARPGPDAGGAPHLVDPGGGVLRLAPEG